MFFTLFCDSAHRATTPPCGHPSTEGNFQAVLIPLRGGVARHATGWSMRVVLSVVWGEKCGHAYCRFENRATTGGSPLRDGVMRWFFIIPFLV